MYLTKEQVQELQDTRIDEKITRFAELFAKRFPQVQELHTGIDEKVEKFARLFPNGTEVTRRLCKLHTDVFSFGLRGARLMPTLDQKAYYLKKVRKVTADYMLRMKHCGHGAMQDHEQRVQKLANSFRKVPNFNREEFIDAMGREFKSSAPVDHIRWSEEEIIRYYNLELALIFYETSTLAGLYRPT